MAITKKRILVARNPLHSVDLIQALVEQNYAPICQPLFVIEPTIDAQLICDIQNKVPQADLIIFVSRNAVDVIASQIDLNPRCILAAVGAATASALLDQGAQKVLYPTYSGSGSDALLTYLHDQKYDLQNKYILLFAGEDGDQGLFASLQACHARPELVTVYRRIIPDKLQLDCTVDAMIVTCVTSLQSLCKHSESRHIPLLVVSDRIKQAALEMGFSTVYTSNGMATTDIVLALRQVIE